MERAVKDWTIAALGGEYNAMHHLIEIAVFRQGIVRKDAMDSTLTAYNNSCAEMRSEARNAYQVYVDIISIIFNPR